MSQSHYIPVYSIRAFSSSQEEDQPFQVEVFDANRHFQVEYPHRHDFYEILFITRGSGVHVIDANKYEIKPPCIFFLSPGQAHKLELSHDIDGYIFIFTADYYLLNKSNRNQLLEYPFFFTVQQDNPPLLLGSESDTAFFRSLFERGIDELTLRKKHYPEMLASILDLILQTSASLYQSSENLENKGKGHIMVKRFLQLVEENYQQNLSVSDYANQLAVSANHLTQTVKQLTGKTSVSIIRSKQIIEIKRLLVHTSLGVAQISEQLGFTDQSYFTKFFKKEVGITPLQFRVKKA